MQKIKKKVFDYMQEYHMLQKDDYVVAGVSGGADSVCLLILLCELRKEIPIELHAVHINHKIRKDADADAVYVKTLCEEFNIPFTLVECDVEQLACKERISTEEAGRVVRYEAFYRTLAVYQGKRRGRIAIAHNKNDCCETFLFHLFRGSGLKGLSGIQPVRDGIIRPLMCLERCEIEAFLDKNGIKYCIDSTNLEDNYTRNKIRHHILETAVKEVNSAAASHIYEACTQISETYRLIEDMTEDSYAACVSSILKEDVCGLHIEQECFAKTHPIIQGYVIMRVIENAAACRKNLESVHAAQIKALFDKQCGRKVDLPYGICAERDYTGIFVYRKIHSKDGKSSAKEYMLSSADKERLLKGEHIEVRLDAGEILVLSVKKSETGVIWKNIPQKKYTKWLDYDKIKNSIVIRTRKKGDYLTIDLAEGEIRKKTLKSYFIDNKIPKEQRDTLFLVAEENHILWIVGGRISSFYKICDNTKRILELRLIMETEKQKG